MQQPSHETLGRILEAFQETGEAQHLQISYIPNTKTLVFHTSVPGNHPVWDKMHEIIQDDPNVDNHVIRPLPGPAVHPAFQEAINALFGTDMFRQKGKAMNESRQVETKAEACHRLAHEHVEHQEAGRFLSKDDLVNLKISLGNTKDVNDFIEGL